MADVHKQKGWQRELTGRRVLLCFVAFFGVVFAVNAIMVRAATSTFGGLETASSYKSGISFNKEQAAAQAQDDLHWTVSAKLARTAPGESGLTVTVRGEDGRAPRNLHAQARLIHPADARRDHDVALQLTADGVFAGQTVTEAGQWDLEIDVLRGEDRMFRSRTRVRVE